MTNEQWDKFRAAEKSQFFYWGEPALKSSADYILALGGRSIGKSYFYANYLIYNWYYTGERFAYIRRYGEDAKPANVARYFSGININKITGGEFDILRCIGGVVYAVKLDDKQAVANKVEIGYYFALALDEHYKSRVYPNVTTAVYEEFITRGKYIPDEPNRLQNLISTIVRNSHAVCVLVGNTLTRACPYFTQWSLTHTPRMTQGDVDIYHMGDSGTEIRVEMCAPAMTDPQQKKSSKLFFGKSRKMIANNEWHSDEFARCPVNPYTDSIVKHTIIFDSVGMSYCVELRRVYGDSKGYFVWVTPIQYRFERCDRVRIVSDRFVSLSPYHQSKFVPLCPAEVYMLDLIAQGKIYYCDNLTGTDFTTALQNLR